MSMSFVYSILYIISCVSFYAYRVINCIYLNKKSKGSSFEKSKNNKGSSFERSKNSNKSRIG